METLPQGPQGETTMRREEKARQLLFWRSRLVGTVISGPFLLGTAVAFTWFGWLPWGVCILVALVWPLFAVPQIRRCLAKVKHWEGV